MIRRRISSSVNRPFELLGACVLLVASFENVAHSDVSCSFPVPVKHPTAQVRFIAFGDSGTGSETQYRLATQMEEARKITGFRTALMLGDNLYPRGDTGAVVNSRFEKPYAELLKAGVKFHPVLGNHDVKKNGGRDEMAYFKMPGYWYSVREGPTEFFMLDSNRRHMSAKQSDWLDTALSASAARWKIVATHHPIYSSGEHWSKWWLKIFIEPLLVKHTVTIVLSGHEHNYQRIDPQRGIYYFVSGGGGGEGRAVKRLEKFSDRVVFTPHFLLFELGDNAGWFQAINVCGRVFDSGNLELRGA